MVMRCRQCGKENADDLEYCFYCGTPLKSDLKAKNTQSAHLEQTSKRKWNKALLLVLSVVLGVGLVGGFCYFFANYSINPKNNDSKQNPSLCVDSELSSSEDYSSFDYFEMNYDDVNETVIVSNKEEFLETKDNLDDIVNKQIIAVDCFFTKKDNTYQITYDKQSYISVICPKRVQVSNILDRTSDVVLFITKYNKKTLAILVFEYGYDSLLSTYKEIEEFFYQDVIGKTAKIVNCTVKYNPDNETSWIHLSDMEWAIGIVSTEMDLRKFEGKTIDLKMVNVDTVPEGTTTFTSSTFWNVYSIDKVY